jgi:hypothetical protein
VPQRGFKSLTHALLMRCYTDKECDRSRRRMLRLFGYNLSALWHVDWCAVHTRSFARGLGRKSESPPHSGGEALTIFYTCPGFHTFRSNSTDDARELSYTAQVSDIGREILTRERRFAGTIRSRDNYATGSTFTYREISSARHPARLWKGCPPRAPTHPPNTAFWALSDRPLWKWRGSASGSTPCFPA